MRRFHWPLQRLLDVTGQREQARRAELLGLSRRIARLRQESLSRRSALRGVLEDFAGGPVQQRIDQQGLLMRLADLQQRQIDRLDKQLEQLTAQRSARTAELIGIRKRRETLQRLGEEARREHVRLELRAEQKLFDESAQLSRARKMIEARVAAADRE